MALSLEITAHAVTAILAAWLGLLVISRARQTAGAPVFGFMSLLLVLWSVAIMGQRLGDNGNVHALLNVVEDFGAFLLPATTAHLAISVAVEGRRSRGATAVILAAYVVGVAAWIQTAVDPNHPILPAPPHFEPFGVPGEILGWAFIAARAAMFAAGIGWLVVAMRRADGDTARRRQLQVMLGTLALGITGGMARILPEGIGGPAWVGIGLVAAAAVLGVYAVLAQRLFAGAELTARTFRMAVIAGAGVVVYVALVASIDTTVRAAIGLDLPIVFTLAMVGTVALYQPASELVRRLLSGGDDRELTLDRLVRALGADILSGRRAESLLEPALARLVRTFDLSGAAILDERGTPVIVHGEPASSTDLPMRVPVEAISGHVAFGHKRSGLPLTPGDIELIRLVTSYVDAASRLDARHAAEADVLAELSREGGAVEAREAALAEALATHEAPARGLRVYALGPLRGEVDGEPVRQWGGAKAGSRQAEAIFAFLFDRGVRGASKDEIVELVWPDVDLDKTDAAFHRTIFGLRASLSGGRAATAGGGPIAFVNDRYVLQLGVVAWSDVAAFDELLARARATGDLDERVRLLETARALYRADAFDDCPFYGDSVHVEETRQELRERYVDLLVDLGEAYARRGDRSGASDALRRAASMTDRKLPVIVEILRALDVSHVGPVIAGPVPTPGVAG